MREKAIERLKVKQPEDMGKKITVQQLDNIVILNIFYNKNLKARYCINKDSGEYETLDFELVASGTWRNTKLGAQFGMAPGDYAYSRYWKNDRIPNEKSVFTMQDMKLLHEIFGSKKDVFKEIDDLECQYSYEKREYAKIRHNERVQKAMEQTPEVPRDIWDWIEELTDGKDQYALRDGDGKWLCSVCHKSFYKERLKTEDKKRPRNNDYAICPECGARIRYKARKTKVDIITHFALIQPVDEKKSIVRYFDAEIYCSGAEGKEVLIDEAVRIELYKNSRKTDCKLYYNQSVMGAHARRRGNMDNMDCLFYDKRSSYGASRYIFSGYIYDGGIKEALKDTAYEPWAAVFEQMAVAGVQADYNRMMIAYYDKRLIGMMEMLFKNKFRKLLLEESKNIDIWGKKYIGDLDKNGESMEEVFGIYDRQKINRIRDRDGGTTMVQWMRYSDEMDEKVSEKALEWIEKNKVSVREAEDILQCMSPEKMMNYVERQKKESYMGKTVHAVIEQYNDYLSMCRKLHKDMADEMVYRPRELKRRHDEAVKELELRRAELVAEEYSERYADAEKVLGEVKQKLEYRGDKYFIMVPKRIVDIVKEGQSLHHCVGSTDRYFDRIKQHETYICFLRKNEKPEEAYYTIEVEPGGTIRQHRGAFDEEPELDEVKPFLKEWQKEIRKRMSQEDHERAAVSKIKREENIMDLKEKNNTRVLNGLLEDFMEAAG